MQHLNEINSQVRQFVLGVARQKGIPEVSDGESLTDNGIMDSLTVFRAVSFLEDTFGIRIRDEEISNENFQSVKCIDDFVLGKLGAKAGEYGRS